MTDFQTYSYETMVFETQLDTFGHLNNAGYLTFYEQARWELIANNGYGIDKIQSEKKGPTILDVHLKFMRELKGRDSITICTQMLSYERKIGRLKQWIINKQGETCSEAIFTFALFDLEKRRLIEPTESWRQALGLPTLSAEN